MSNLGIPKGKVRCNKCGKSRNHMIEQCGCNFKSKFKNPRRYERKKLNKLVQETKRHLRLIKQMKKLK